jgi:hypothetical protein
MGSVIIDYGGLGRVKAEAVRGCLPIVEDMADDMRRYAPVLSGELVASIRVEPGSAVHRIWIGDVAGGVDYHLYQEFGTSVMAAQPYIRPAVYQKRG